MRFKPTNSSEMYVHELEAHKANAMPSYAFAGSSFEQTSWNKCHIEILRHRLLRVQW